MRPADASFFGWGLAISLSIAGSASTCLTRWGHCANIPLEVANSLRGEGPATHLPQQHAPHPVPIDLTALTSQNSEIADGVMPLWWSVERVARGRRWIERGRGKSRGRAKLELTPGLPTYVGDDIDALRSAARANLGLFTGLPFIQRLIRASGFTQRPIRRSRVAAARL